MRTFPKQLPLATGATNDIFGINSLAADNIVSSGEVTGTVELYGKVNLGLHIALSLPTQYANPAFDNKFLNMSIRTTSGVIYRMDNSSGTGTCRTVQIYIDQSSNWTDGGLTDWGKSGQTNIKGIAPSE
jgi:hypothetical protein